MSNAVWVNAIGLVYRDSRPKDPKRRAGWAELVNQAIAKLRADVGDGFDEIEFRARTMSPKPDGS